MGATDRACNSTHKTPQQCPRTIKSALCACIAARRANACAHHTRAHAQTPARTRRHAHKHALNTHTQTHTSHSAHAHNMPTLASRTRALAHARARTDGCACVRRRPHPLDGVGVRRGLALLLRIVLRRLAARHIGRCGAPRLARARQLAQAVPAVVLDAFGRTGDEQRARRVCAAVVGREMQGGPPARCGAAAALAGASAAGRRRRRRGRGARRAHPKMCFASRSARRSTRSLSAARAGAATTKAADNSFTPVRSPAATASKPKTPKPQNPLMKWIISII